MYLCLRGCSPLCSLLYPPCKGVGNSNKGTFDVAPVRNTQGSLFPPPTPEPKLASECPMLGATAAAVVGSAAMAALTFSTTTAAVRVLPWTSLPECR